MSTHLEEAGKSKFDWDLIRKTSVRVIRDLWIPAAVALVIEIFRSYQKWPGFFTFLGALFTTMFYAGSYFGYIQRAKKFVIDERHHHKVTGKQDALTDRLEKLADVLSDRQEVVLTRFEALRDDLEGLTTGGKGFAHVFFVRTTDTAITEFDVSVDGDFPLQEVSLGIDDFETLRSRLELVQRTGDPLVFLNRDFRHKFGTMLPGFAYPIRCNLPIRNQNRIRFHLHWEAKNGTWYQRIQLEKIDGVWRTATIVKRKEEQIYSRVDDAYPRDALGEPIFNDHEII